MLHREPLAPIGDLYLLSFVGMEETMPEKYSVTRIQRPPKGNNKSCLLQQVVFKCTFC